MKNVNSLLVFCLLLWSSTVFTQELQDELSRQIEAMVKVGECHSPSFSPDGKEIAFISNLSGSPQLWKISRNGGWPIKLTAFNDPVSDPKWSPTEDKIVFEMSPGGGSNSQIFLINSDGTGLQQITSGGKINNWIDVWSRDGDYLAYSSNQNNPAGMDCYLYDLQNDYSKMIVKNPGIGMIRDINSDNSQFLLLRQGNIGDNDILLIDTAGNERLLTKHSGSGTIVAKFSSTGKIYVVTNVDRDLLAFGIIENKKIRIIGECKNSDLVRSIINHEGTRTLHYCNMGGKDEISLFDLEKEKKIKDLKMPVERISSGEFSACDRYYVFTGHGSAEPYNIWLYDIENDTFKRLTDSPHPGINLDSLVSPDLVEFESFDGLNLSGWLYKPKNAVASYPTVIDFHGGPGGQSRPDFNYAYQALLSQGIAVFSPNVRGSSGFGKKFINLDKGALRANSIKDIAACYEYLVNSGFSMDKKVGIMGASEGGYYVMAGITEFPEMFAAAANSCGFVNFKTMFENMEPWLATILKEEYGYPETDLSPIQKIDAVVTPTLVLHGANDTYVPVVESEQVVENLKERNIPVKYILFPDEGHGWTKTKNQVISTVAIVNWFKKYLIEE